MAQTRAELYVHTGYVFCNFLASLVFLSFCLVFPDPLCGGTCMAFVFISDLDLVKEHQPTLQPT